jgi:alginate O-acetyltransferase complex protein AlgI
VWLAVAAYTGQIYYDFSGYTDMATGCGRMFGFEFPPNFRHPYTSRSITEFWRRWHITLSTWLRDYLYIPLGGNRWVARAPT